MGNDESPTRHNPGFMQASTDYGLGQPISNGLLQEGCMLGTRTNVVNSNASDTTVFMAAQPQELINAPVARPPVSRLLSSLQQHPFDSTQGKTMPYESTCNSSSSGSIPATPSSGNCGKSIGGRSEDKIAAAVDTTELLSLQIQLEMAQKRIARMDQELHQSRITGHTLDHIATLSETDLPHNVSISQGTEGGLQINPNSSNHGNSPPDSWPLEEPRHDHGPLGGQAFGLKNNIWGGNIRTPYQYPLPTPTETTFPINMTQWQPQEPKAMYHTGMESPVTPALNQPSVLWAPNLRATRFGFQGTLQPHFPTSLSFGVDPNSQRSVTPQNVAASPVETTYNGWIPYDGSACLGDGSMGPQMPTMGLGPSSGPGLEGGFNPYQYPYTSRGSTPAPGYGATVPGYPWNNTQTRTTSPQESVYMAPSSMNYRQLLDKNLDCNWKLIVDKIVNQNDQQASIFLQQKLKVANARQKFNIVDVIVGQAFSLMTNRFGNFLVQRCFEHGTPEQVIAIANEIRGKTLQLSMDPFGCHVIQKAFDCVPEEYKAIMVHELLLRIPETVIHRYACHVWQKLFELRWKNSPPQIMRYVNESLRGMWHEVALGETGSLVVQNIFENCLEEDKRPCINEVLASIDVIAHGQFGNWCIQHICEHGAPADRKRAIDHILRFAMEYSVDQYASKVIEKCLKIGGKDFLDRYLDRICEAHADRPRMPLIDIAGDQFGNYLIQYILLHCGPHYRDIVANHVRKHMVSLRGSKYGSRVAMLCCNPAVSTRPGPPPGMQVGGRFNGSTTANPNRNAYGGAYRN